MFSVSSVGGLVCCGGEDDNAFVWRFDDGGVVFQCDGEKTTFVFVVCLMYNFKSL